MKILKLLVLNLSLLIVSNLALAEFPNILKQHYAPAIIIPDRINITSPDIAELNSQVQVKVDSLQLPTKQSYVTEISIYINNKSSLPLATYLLSETSIADGLISRIKLPYGKNTIYMVARLKDGRVIGGETTTKAIYACNGGM